MVCAFLPVRDDMYGGRHLLGRTWRKCARSSLYPSAGCLEGSFPPTGLNVLRTSKGRFWLGSTLWKCLATIIDMKRQRAPKPGSRDPNKQAAGRILA